MAYIATTNQEEIRNWIAEHNGQPIISRDGTGIEKLALVFNAPLGLSTISAEVITWEEFFDRFNSQNLVFQYDKDGEERGEFAYALLNRELVGAASSDADDGGLEMVEDDIPQENIMPSASLEEMEEESGIAGSPELGFVL